MLTHLISGMDLFACGYLSKTISNFVAAVQKLAGIYILGKVTTINQNAVSGGNSDIWQ